MVDAAVCSLISLRTQALGKFVEVRHAPILRRIVRAGLPPGAGCTTRHHCGNRIELMSRFTSSNNLTTTLLDQGV
jgi:hypothetical protein